jgi:hypothetical protein
MANRGERPSGGGSETGIQRSPPSGSRHQTNEGVGCLSWRPRLGEAGLDEVRCRPIRDYPDLTRALRGGVFDRSSSARCPTAGTPECSRESIADAQKAGTGRKVRACPLQSKVTIWRIAFPSRKRSKPSLIRSSGSRSVSRRSTGSRPVRNNLRYRGRSRRGTAVPM